MISQEITVVAELAAGLPAPPTLELIDFAKTLRIDPALPVRVFVLGETIERAVALLSEIPDVVVTGLAGASLAVYSAEVWKNVLAPRLAEIKPRFVCASHDATGADFAPGLAVRLGAGCITAIESAKGAGGETIFRRSLLNGKIKAEVASQAETTVITLLPGMYRSGSAGEAISRLEGDSLSDGRLLAAKAKIIAIEEMLPASRHLGFLSAPEQDADLAAAEVVVAVGRGIGKEENLSLIHDLAALFSSSAVGASRPVCDAGWLPPRLQIGQTGKTVTPRLYIACGISGALQHLMGMRGSQFIVAVNSDPRAAIFQVADVCIVEDILLFIPLLINACKRQKHDKDAP
ncbi:MAG: electron transfer flavoprotein subunit alpha/FixB family protein [Syntrophales bacterium]